MDLDSRARNPQNMRDAHHLGSDGGVELPRGPQCQWPAVRSVVPKIRRPDDDHLDRVPPFNLLRPLSDEESDFMSAQSVDLDSPGLRSLNESSLTEAAQWRDFLDTWSSFRQPDVKYAEGFLYEEELKMAARELDGQPGISDENEDTRNFAAQTMAEPKDTVADFQAEAFSETVAATKATITAIPPWALPSRRRVNLGKKNPLPKPAVPKNPPVDTPSAPPAKGATPGSLEPKVKKAKQTPVERPSPIPMGSALDEPFLQGYYSGLRAAYFDQLNNYEGRLSKAKVPKPKEPKPKGQPPLPPGDTMAWEPLARGPTGDSAEVLKKTGPPSRRCPRKGEEKLGDILDHPSGNGPWESSYRNTAGNKPHLQFPEMTVDQVNLEVTRFETGCENLKYYPRDPPDVVWDDALSEDSEPDLEDFEVSHIRRHLRMWRRAERHQVLTRRQTMWKYTRYMRMPE